MAAEQNRKAPNTDDRDRKRSLNRARVLWHAGRSYSSERVRERLHSVSRVSESVFDQLLADYSADVAFVHAGLSDVRAAFGENPYEFLYEGLTRHFDSVLTAGFTPSFLDSGVYHKDYSRPEFGTFAQLFLDDADYRTDDAVFSIQVHGDYRFDDSDHSQSFGRNSCWNRLDRDDVLFLNVGTSGLRCAHLHYAEQYYEVPYITVSAHEGIVYVDDTEYKHVEQHCPTDDIYRRFNRKKIQQYLSNVGAIECYECNGLQLRFGNARRIRTALGEQLSRDPYYLIT